MHAATWIVCMTWNVRRVPTSIRTCPIWSIAPLAPLASIKWQLIKVLRMRIPFRLPLLSPFRLLHTYLLGALRITVINKSTQLQKMLEVYSLYIYVCACAYKCLKVCAKEVFVYIVLITLIRLYCQWNAADGEWRNVYISTSSSSSSARNHTHTHNCR